MPLSGRVVRKLADVERSLAFYCDELGLEPVRADEWRRSETSDMCRPEVGRHELWGRAAGACRADVVRPRECALGGFGVVVGVATAAALPVAAHRGLGAGQSSVLEEVAADALHRRGFACHPHSGARGEVRAENGGD